MKLHLAINDVQEAENHLAHRLRAIGERHAPEADVYYMSDSLAKQCAQHLDRLRPFAEQYGAKDVPDDAAESPGLLETVRRKTSQALKGSDATAVLFVSDLRELYVAAQDAEIAWIILLQSAKARRDADLIHVVTGCHEHAQTRAKWVRTRIKEAAPQVYAAG